MQRQLPGALPAHALPLPLRAGCCAWWPKLHRLRELRDNDARTEVEERYLLAQLGGDAPAASRALTTLRRMVAPSAPYAGVLRGTVRQRWPASRLREARLA